MHPHAALLTRFYKAFQARDHQGMRACYHPEVSFSDPVFPNLQGKAAGDMWRMLCVAGEDLELEFNGVEADDHQGKAHWEARYTFAATGRKVHNVIDASFTFKDGLIHSHKDHFDLWRWSRQALGAKGTLLGWAPPVQKAIQKQAGGALRAFNKKHGAE